MPLDQPSFVVSPPEVAWALKHRDRFPVDINRAPSGLLLRVPGLGTKAVGRILSARRHARLRLDDLTRMSASSRRAAAVIVTADHRAPGLGWLDLRSRLVRPPEQLSSSHDPDRLRHRRRPRRFPPGGARARRCRVPARAGNRPNAPRPMLPARTTGIEPFSIASQSRIEFGPKPDGQRLRGGRERIAEVNVGVAPCERVGRAIAFANHLPQQ